MRSMRNLVQEFNVFRWAGPHAARRRAHAPSQARAVARARRAPTKQAPALACRGMPPFDATGRCSSTSTARCSRSRRRRRRCIPARADTQPHRRAVRRRPAARSRWSAAARSPRSTSCSRRSGCPAAGQHGVERRDARGPRPSPSVPGRRAARAPRSRSRDFAARHDGPRLRGQGLRASRCTTASRRGSQAPRTRWCATRRAPSASGVEVQAGKMVVELKPAGHDKGRAIEAFMERSAVRAAACRSSSATTSPTRTASASCSAWAATRSRSAPAHTVAPWRLLNPAAARAWLGDWLEHCVGMMAPCPSDQRSAERQARSIAIAAMLVGLWLCLYLGLIGALPRRILVHELVHAHRAAPAVRRSAAARARAC